MNEKESRKFEALLEDGPEKRVWLTVNLLGIEKQAAEKIISEIETVKDRIKEILASYMKLLEETRKEMLSSDTEEGMIETRRRENDKQAAEYIRRLAKGEFPEMEVEVNYSESKIDESDG